MSKFKRGVFVPVKQSLSFFKDKAFRSIRQNMDIENRKEFLNSEENVIEPENGEKNVSIRDTSASNRAVHNKNADIISIKTDSPDIAKLLEMHFKTVDKYFDQIQRTFFSRGNLERLANFENITKLPVVLGSFQSMDNVLFHPDKFEILIDARGFKPEEIKCSITQKSVEVLAEKQDHAENTQKKVALSRQYVLPQKAVPENGICCLSTEGILLISAPWNKS